MKEFITAVEDIAAEDDYETKIAALVEQGKTRDDAEAEVDNELGIVPFKVDGRVLKAYPLEDGQLAFMLASLGRGQRQDQRFASIVNLMLSSLRNEDQDYMEGRLLSRDPKERLPISQVEAIFEYLTEEWFARPTQSPSGSVGSQPNGGQNSTQPSTNSPEDSSESAPTDS